MAFSKKIFAKKDNKPCTKNGRLYHKTSKLTNLQVMKEKNYLHHQIAVKAGFSVGLLKRSEEQNQKLLATQDPVPFHLLCLLHSVQNVRNPSHHSKMNTSQIITENEVSQYQNEQISKISKISRSKISNSHQILEQISSSQLLTLAFWLQMLIADLSLSVLLPLMLLRVALLATNIVDSLSASC